MKNRAVSASSSAIEGVVGEKLASSGEDNALSERSEEDRLRDSRSAEGRDGGGLGV